jgi:hypothetical protein
MNTMTSNIPSVTPEVEAAIVLTLQATGQISREALEETVFRVERVLEEHLANIAPGASACADFEHDSVEIDISLTGLTSTELHRHLATIVDTLEQECVWDIHDRLMLASSVTRMTDLRDTVAA